MNNIPDAENATTQSQTIYTRTFWLCYLANVLLVTANALTFRFAEFVAYLGGEERIVGTIVSVGMVAAVVSRLAVGQAIDHYGTRVLWRMSSLVLAASCPLFLAVETLSWPIYAVRILFAVSMACMFSCSIVYIQQMVPARRRTEVIASLGSSGFVGMVIGPQLGDLIFNSISSEHVQFAVLFGTAGLLGLLYFAIIHSITAEGGHQRPAESVAAHRLLLRYWPGQILLIAIVLGSALTVPTVFLTRYATELNLRGIGTFFLMYSGTAFTCRLLAARWMERVGLRRMVLIGMAALGCGQFLFLPVHLEWHFLFPAAVCGLGHALLFPVVISIGSGSFPREFRGTGTTLILGFTEIGIIIAAPLLGTLIDLFGFHVMFMTAGAVTLSIGLLYYLSAAEPVDLALREDERLSGEIEQALPVATSIHEEKKPAASIRQPA